MVVVVVVVGGGGILPAGWMDGNWVLDRRSTYVIWG